MSNRAWGVIGKFKFVILTGFNNPGTNNPDCIWINWDKSRVVSG